MIVKCFMVEPMLDVPNSLPFDRDDWDPKCRGITGWRRSDDWSDRRDHAHQFGPGAMYFATWLPKCLEWDDETEPHLYVETPGGAWDIDSRSENCQMSGDRRHRCWIRHGTPPDITVSKIGGRTCAAGGGSILTPRYHGFLINGSFT